MSEGAPKMAGDLETLYAAAQKTGTPKIKSVFKALMLLQKADGLDAHLKKYMKAKATEMMKTNSLDGIEETKVRAIIKKL